MDRIARLKQYMEASPDDSFLQHALALEYIKAGNDEEAKKLFCELLNRDPAYVGSYYHLGKLSERNGDAQEALKIYKKGMEAALAANDSHSYNELQSAYNNIL